jgi:hypothetical protein
MFVKQMVCQYYKQLVLKEIERKRAEPVSGFEHRMCFTDTTTDASVDPALSCPPGYARVDFYLPFK